MEILSILLALGVMALILRTTYEQRKYKWLNQYGTRVAAVITRMWKATITWRDGSEYDWYVVTAKWTDPRTSQTYIYWKTGFLGMIEEYPVGSFVYIFIDPNNPGQYYMEL